MAGYKFVVSTKKQKQTNKHKLDTIKAKEETKATQYNSVRRKIKVKIKQD
jgi:hypothetical protein